MGLVARSSTNHPQYAKKSFALFAGMGGLKHPSSILSK